ncbi:MAG: hypothetical protein K2J32_01165 [Ruminococcus sp.]|nr:hypothetical protein [Ruminococcus sp.]
MSTDLKEKVRKIVHQRNLCSYMNDTKWNELRNAMMNEMPFSPPYIVKFLFEDKAEREEYFFQDVYYSCDWYYVFAIENHYFNGAFAVEWIKVRPRYLKYRGQLIEPEIIEAENEFIEILKKYSIPYEESNGVYCIYGYH